MRSWLPIFLAPMLVSDGYGKASTASAHYLVTFEQPAAIEAVLQQAKSAGVSPPMAQLRSQAKSLSLSMQNVQQRRVAEFSSVLRRSLRITQQASYLSNMVGLELSQSEAQSLREQPGVAAVEPVEERFVQTDAGPNFIGATQVWNAPAASGGNRGEGIVIGVIDSGVNSAHPSFADIAADGYNHQNPRGQRYGLCNSIAAARCNDKLIGLYDFTEEGNKDGADADGHGTHVASTAAGNPVTGFINGPTVNFPVSVSGIAPRANIISYKTCIKAASGPTTCPFTIAAIDAAARDGVDVINYSIGGNARDPWAALSSSGASDFRSMFNARAAGIVVVVSAGNEGPNPGTITAPANAPWVIAAANISHDRRFVNTIIAGPGAPQASFSGVGITAALSERPIVLGESFGFSLCGEGEDLAIPPTGISNRFAPNTFNGQIVVCDRGQQARVAKGFNVNAAGAGGMILLNTALEGESVVADAHVLPTVHLPFSQAAAIKAWVRGGGARASMSGMSSIRLPSAGDRLSSSSSRGPALGGVLKPDISAPGSDVLAADLNSGIRSLSGTSMSAPHIAGAAALIQAAHPNWSVDQIESAIRLSGLRNSVRVAAALADTFEAGGGRLQAQLALNSPLSFPLSDQTIRANAGNDPAALNLPSIFIERCFEQCQFTRTVRANDALGAGNWSVRVEAPTELVASVTPNQFTLGSNATQALNIRFDTRNPTLAGQRTSAYLVFSRAGTAELSLPVLIGSPISANSFGVPSEVTLNASSERGNARFELSGLVALPSAAVNLQSLSKVQVLSQNVAVDPTGGDFHDDNGRIFRLIDVPAGSPALVVRLDASSARDVDLYVGYDSDGDGVSENSEIDCRSDGPGTSERCTISNPLQGRYWVIAQNLTGSPSGDLLTLSTVAINPALKNAAATTSGKLPALNAFTTDVAYDLGGSVPGDEYIGQLTLRTDANTVKPAATILVRVQRTAGTEAPMLLLNGVPSSIALSAGVARDRIGFEAPINSNLITLSGSSSSAVQLDWVLAPDNEAQLDRAPAGSALSGSSQPNASGGHSFELRLTQPALIPGRRYYLRLRSASNATVNLTASYSAAANSPAIAPELYYNPARSGHGLIITRAREDAQVMWFTYDKQAQPTWYWYFPNRFFASDAPLQQSGALLRYVWDGTTARGTEVGTATITRTGINKLTFSYTLMGETGSEPMVLLDQSNCLSTATPAADYTGAWYNDAESGWGASVHLRDAVEFIGFFVYDEAGIPRWVLASESTALSATANSREVPLYQHQGFCPTCAYVPDTRRLVGRYRMNLAPFVSGQVTRATVDLQIGYLAPLLGRFDRQAPFARLTGEKLCR